MLFNSVEFIFFLPIVLLVFYLLNHQFKIWLLLAASYFFYISWNPIYIFLIFSSTIIDYTAGLLLSKTEKSLQRKAILYGSILFNLGVLVYFKYIDFFMENINRFILSPNNSFELLDLVLPVGISFYTFQTMSYTIDVYNKQVDAEKRFDLFALYVCFFPQLVAGPIERYADLSIQFKTKFSLTVENLKYGGRLILYGFFMKMVVADNIAPLVDDTYLNIDSTHSLQLFFYAALYSIQIYCDFHGYSTIAIGTARLFDIRLSDNFKSPYTAISVTDFWRKWHISLTNWFRDYIYYPLGGNKQGLKKWIFSTLIVFIVSGFWHGAKWTFIFWGILHGLFVLFEKIFKADKASNHKALTFLRVIFTFVIISLMWIFFRSPDLATALTYFKGLVFNFDQNIVLNFNNYLVYIVGFITLEFILNKRTFAEFIEQFNLPIRWSVYFILVFLILSQSGADANPFIYFQF